ncbi:hypothetical protein FQZ97_802640 [compost metagenome]
MPQQLDREARGVVDGDDLVVLPVQHQCRHGDLLQVFGEVGFREGRNAVVMGLGAAVHALAPPVVDHCFGDLCARPVESIEGARRHVAVEVRTAGGECFAEAIEHF